jgi:hypothetical protein
VTATDYEVEQEVDVGRWVGAVLTRWWLPVLGLGGSQVYRAQATIYLGQPYGGIGSQQPLVNLQTSPSSVRQIVTAESTIDSVAAAAGMPSGQLRGNVAVSAVATSTSAAKVTQAPLVTITVTGKAPRKVRTAANKLANAAVLKLSGYPSAKIDKLKQQIAFDESQLSALGHAHGSDSATAAVLAIQEGQIEQDKLNATQLLTQAQQVESPRIVTGAAAHKVTARSRRNTMVVAGLIGLLLGILAALLWEPVAGRFARR